MSDVRVLTASSYGTKSRAILEAGLETAIKQRRYYQAEDQTGAVARMEQIVLFCYAELSRVTLWEAEYRGS